MATVAILGSGNAGCTFAAYLGKRGHEVRLYDSARFEDNLTAIREQGGMTLTGVDTGYGEIAMVTTDIKEAIKGVEIIMVVVPGFGHVPIARDIAPYLKAEQVVVLNPGAAFGALEFLNTLRDNGNHEDVTICETASNVFACRRTGPTSVNLTGIKDEMEIASIPCDRIGDVVKKLDVFFPGTFRAQPNVIYTSLSYNNMIIHPAGALLNMGRIEWTKGDYDFYWEGCTPGVCHNIEQVDAERLKVAESFGVKLIDFLEQNHEYYGHRERKSIYEFFSVSEVHGGIGPSAPSALTHRYVTEDIPYALVAVSSVARAIGVETPVIDAMIAIASAANQQNYRESGRSLKNLKLDGLTKEQIFTRLTTGK